MFYYYCWIYLWNLFNQPFFGLVKFCYCHYSEWWAFKQLFRQFFFKWSIFFQDLKILRAVHYAFLLFYRHFQGGNQFYYCFQNHKIYYLFICVATGLISLVEVNSICSFFTVFACFCIWNGPVVLCLIFLIIYVFVPLVRVT